MSRLLYYEDPLLFEFQAKPVGIEPVEGSRCLVELDQTAFYPEGGGQPADRGTIGGIRVVDVKKRDGRVLHLLDDIPEGGELACRIDAAHRRAYMQQHTGQHLLSSALLKRAGLNTVAVHQGEELTTIEVDSAEVSEEQMRGVEEAANALIEADLPVSAKEVDESELADYPLRREAKVGGVVRLVFIGDADCAACGGVHLPRTGMVRLVQHAGIERIRGRARTAWRIGDRAIADYAHKTAICNWISTRYSVPPRGIIERLEQEAARLAAAESEVGQEREARAGLVAKSLARAGVVTARLQGETPSFLRSVAERLVETPGISFCLLSVREERLHWSIGAGAGGEVPFAAVRSELLPLIDGKGGGKPPLWQGVGGAPAGADQFLSGFQRLCGAPK